MNNITMKNIFKHATLCIAVACMFLTTSFCMDKPDAAWLPSSNVARVLSFLLTEKTYLFDHFMICSLGINKEWDMVLRNTAGKIRQYLIKCMPNPIRDKNDTEKKLIILHKYGSACAKVELADNGNARLEVEMLPSGRHSRWCSLNMWITDSCNYISDCARPRFSKEGNLYYYVLGDIHNHDRQIIEHRRLLDVGQHLYRPIELRIHKDRFHVNLIDFLSFPVFLNACTRALVEWRDKRVCDLQNVRLPDDYKKCIPHDQCQFKSYSELPDWWREAIDRRYHEQQKK